jgi:Tol biopolymer transport system component
VSNADGSGDTVTVAENGSARRAFPTWSPDGSRLLFSALRDGGGELWSVGPDGKAPRLVIRREKNVFISPVFSPSGDSVYFGALAERTRDLGIWQQRLRPDGSPDGAPAEVARTGNTVPIYLSMSRDGRRISYTAMSSTSHLWSVGMRGAESTGDLKPVYEDNVFRASFPTFSPDGSKIAFFARLFGGGGDIWMANADGTGAAQMKTSGSPEVMPDWTRDGSAIRYGRITGQGVQLWERSVSDQSDRPATAGGRAVPGWPRVSADGRRVVYHSQSHERMGDGILNIFVADLPDLSHTRQVTQDAEGAGFPSWSPDGKWIGYELFRGPHTYLAVMDAEGRGQEQLNVEPGHAWLFGWSPDSSKILFAGFREGAWNLWWLDRATREQRRLTDYRSLRTFVRYPAWSPRGDRVVYELGTTRGNVYRVDLE